MARPGTIALVAWLVAGALVRAVALPRPGTADVGTWKIWTFAGATDATGFYGAGGSPPERRLLKWRGEQGTTEYVPLALYQLAAVGRVYARIDPLYRDSVALTILVKAPALIAEIALIVFLLTAGRRWLGEEESRIAALVIWLNPAMLLNGAVLGYLDIQMAVPATIAMLCALNGRPALAGVLLAAAILTKPQAVFAAPFIAIAAAARSKSAGMLKLGTAFSVTAGLILLPIVLRGAWPNMVQAVKRLNAHDMLSGEATNAWWIVTWVIRVIDAAPDIGVGDAVASPVRILSITRFMALGYPNPRIIGAVIVVAGLAWACWRAWQARSEAAIVMAAVWSVLLYGTFQVQVHENHLLVAVPLSVIAAVLDRRLTGVMIGVSAVCALNMYVFQGLGAGLPPLLTRRLTWIDPSVILAFVSVGVFVIATAQFAELCEGRRWSARAGDDWRPRSGDDY